MTLLTRKANPKHGAQTIQIVYTTLLAVLGYSRGTINTWIEVDIIRKTWLLRVNGWIESSRL